MTSFPWVIFIALALVWVSASGAISDSLELNDCLKLAEIRNPRGMISSHAVDAANLSLKELQVQRYPQIKYKGSLEYAPISHHFGYDPSLTNGGLLGSQIVVEQTIYDGGQRRLKLKQLELDLARTGHEKRVSTNELRYNIEVAFTELLRAQAVADLKRRSHIQLQGYLKLVQRMQGGGQAGYTDILKTKIQMSEANSEWNEAEVEMVVDNYTLADLIGLSKVDSLKIKGSLEDLDVSSKVESVQKGDTVQNSEFEIARMDIQAAQLDAKIAGAEWKPILSVFADMGLLTSWENLDAPSNSRANMLGGSLGLHVDWPLFNWGLKGLRARQKLLTVETMQWQFELKRRTLIADYRKSELQWKAVKDRLDSEKENVEAAKDNFLLTQSKYAGGSGLASDVLEAHRLWVETQLSLLRARADLRLLNAKMRRLNVH